jgi:hypothetical protein
MIERDDEFAEFRQWLDREWATYLEQVGDAWSPEGFREHRRKVSNADPDLMQLLDAADCPAAVTMRVCLIARGTARRELECLQPWEPLDEAQS